MPPRDARAGDPLFALKLRTLGVALLMAALLALGLWQTLGAADLFMGGGTGPGGVHVPAPVVSDGTRIGLVRGLMVLLLALALVGYSWARFGRLSPAWLFPLLVAVLVGTQWVGLPLIPLPLGSRTGDVARAAARQPPEQVGRLMDQRGHGDVARAYVLAQMALRDKQPEALRKHGTVVLDAVDRITYGSLQDAQGYEALQFDPGVVARLDRGMHGEPVSEPGLRSAGGTQAPERSGMGRWLRLLLGAMSLVAGLVTLALWLKMQRRVVELALDAGEADPAAVASGQAPPAS